MINKIQKGVREFSQSFKSWLIGSASVGTPEGCVPDEKGRSFRSGPLLNSQIGTFRFGDSNS
jgi:hypothetical protein